jgi:hypothetical protein
VSRYRTEVRFRGTPPPVKAGDPVEIRDANGGWWPATAASEPRYDKPNAAGWRCHLTVSVAVGAWPHPVNWPAEHVRPAETGGRP